MNTFVDSPHFKMESIRNVISMFHKGVWMASVDLKDAFFTVPINVHGEKYLNPIRPGGLRGPDGQTQSYQSETSYPMMPRLVTFSFYP